MLVLTGLFFISKKINSFPSKAGKDFIKQMHSLPANIPIYATFKLGDSLLI
jgi:hypothetical protein